MNKEELIKQGLTEEQADNVLKMYKASIDGNYVPKATFDSEREKSKTLTEQVSERDKQITELGKFKGTAEELEVKVSDLEKSNAEAKIKYEADLLRSQKDAAVKLAISNKVIDPEDVIPKLDMEKITIKDGKIEGIDSQLEEIKKAKPHYFKQEQPNEPNKPKGWIFGVTPTEGGEDGTGSESKTAADFGKSLAGFKSESESAASKASEHYFK